MATAVRWDEAWVEALAAMELAAEDAERLLALDHLPDPAEVALVAHWEPTSELGPLPASLRVRAQALFDRQRDLAQRTARAIVSTQRHLRAIDAMQPRSAAVPVYLDTSA